MKETLDDLKTRRSCRDYKSGHITDEEMDAILEAGTYAPTGHGNQSPIIVCVRNEEDIKTLRKINAELLGISADPFYGASDVVAVLADPVAPTWVEDGSLVLGNLMNAAHAIGVGSCWINRARETFDRSDGKELLKKWGINGKYRGVGFCILGYENAVAPARARKTDYITIIR